MSTTGFGISLPVSVLSTEHTRKFNALKMRGSLYFNKDYHSLVVQAVADANNIVVLKVGDYGRNSDGSVLRESAFGQDFENNRLDIPPTKTAPK